MAVDVQHLRDENTRIEWTDAVHRLLNDVKNWAAQEGWGTETHEIEVMERISDVYRVASLVVTTPHGNIVLEPVSRQVYGAAGRIDLYDQISMARVMLLLKPGGTWIVRTDSGINWPNPWGAETFSQLVHGLLNPE